MALIKPMVSSKSNEWETPQDLFDKLNNEFSFEIDVSANSLNAKCPKYFTIKENGLLQNWAPHTCWMNPPYGGQAGKWIEKAYLESLIGATMVCLIVVGTDRSYWHDYIFPHAKQIRFLRGGLKFGKAKGKAPFASAIVIFGTQEYDDKIIYYPRKERLAQGVLI